MQKIKGRWLFPVLIIVLGIAGYANTFSVPFVFDDKNIIIDNPVIKHVDLLLERSEVRARYLGYLTFALNYRIHGLDVAGFHAFNLLVHIINALLVYWLAILTSRTPFFRAKSREPRVESFSLFTFHFSRFPQGIAFFGALLFVCHPVQTQAVTYIVQRFTSLATLFYLLSLVLYIKARTTTEKVKAKVKVKEKSILPFFSASALTSTFYLLSLVSAVLAMKTKEIAFTLPLVIALYEFMFFQGKPLKRLLILFPLLLTLVIIPLSMIGIEKPLGEVISDVSQATRVQTGLSRTDYLFTQFRVIVTYIRLLVLPVNQNLDYDYPIYRSFSDPNVFLSFLFLLSLFCLGLFFLFRSLSNSQKSGVTSHELSAPADPLRRVSHESRVLSSDYSPFTFHLSRLVAFGIFWFFITLSVESSIIPIVDVIYEHRLYLPSVGACMAAAGLCGMLIQQYRGKWEWIEKTILIVLTAMVLVLAGITFSRNAVWKDETVLWKDVVKKSPDKARPHHGLGVTYAKRGMLDEAVTELERATVLDPLYPLGHHDLGSAYIEKGRFDDALLEFRKTLELAPQYSSSYTGMGTAYLRKGMIDKAIEFYQLAVSFNIYDQTAQYNLEYARRLKKSPLQ